MAQRGGRGVPVVGRRCSAALIAMSAAAACNMESPPSDAAGGRLGNRPPPSMPIAGRVETFRPRLTFEHVSPPGPMRPVATVGSAAPFSSVWAGANGRWVALCQGTSPSSSDEVQQHGEVSEDIRLHLVVGRGEGVPIDDLAADPTGRWIMTMRGSTLELRDTIADRVTRLPQAAALAEEDAGYIHGGRFASFEPSGSHVM
jgi:hypothetical protein